MTKYNVFIVERSTGELEDRITQNPVPFKTAVKIKSGASINLNHEDYKVDILSEFFMAERSVDL